MPEGFLVSTVICLLFFINLDTLTRAGGCAWAVGSLLKWRWPMLEESYAIYIIFIIIVAVAIRK